MKILVIAPHPDDEIIGVGGTIIKNIEQGNTVYICIVTKGCTPIFPVEQVNQVQNEARKCHATLGITKTFFLDFPAAMLDTVRQYELNGRFIDVLKEVKPDEVYIPHVGDIHKDHKIVAESAMVAMRPKYDFAPNRIFAYETLSETGWDIPNVQNQFIPNTFVDISNQLPLKLAYMNIYQSQISEYPDARSLKAIKALAMMRGAEMNRDAVEAFVQIRSIN